MAKRKTLEEKLAEDLEKLEKIGNISYFDSSETEKENPIINNCMPEIHADTIQEVKEVVKGIMYEELPEVNIWADLTIPDEESKENENAAELIHDNFSSVSLENLEDSVDESPKPTTYKINKDKDSGLNIPTVTAPVQKTKSNSRSAIKGVYCLNGKIGRN